MYQILKDPLNSIKKHSVLKSQRKRDPEGNFILRYLSAPGENFKLELTWLKDHPQNYELGENESHLAFRVDGDYDAVREYHREMGAVCFENEKMGIYFINDPDDYWIEILPSLFKAGK